ncbi:MULTISPECIES: Tat pathway signal sequence domain protein [Streptomyces]|uniref:Tat pathway signal sequence domain protein n=1 Tax=Streptomyces tsukubensis (strain DSM 42081 / NBRC 108919 / NRRL 18488 / 9993) TaxID=1114943 RepID=A0A7G3UGX9_STRT9|nr:MULTISPECIES: Tat pathway signal sequence domain protein [Streptomyces]MYS68444.1 XRE family transcriptional regulator [Streptomyces sp. SID5473]QKM68360.1 Tat pathway signal sequence domain protein [Streptomyces tsukubensis NRRL18488]TAI43177.1 XRE family transcriptional regulator [Streptomyces tsukubensis]
MDATRNTVLEVWMAEHGYSSNSLADAVNRSLEQLTGRSGGLDGSSVRGWKAGRVKWPKSATRKALEEIAGLPATALGFVPRGRTPSSLVPPQQEDPDMKRRTLVGGITAAAVAAASPGTASPRRIGMSDVDRLQKRFAEIIASDHRHGGQLGIEQRAAALADEALNLQNAGSATQRVRSSLYASAAAFRSSAMWAAIDGRRYDDAKTHMREAQTLAEMSGDQTIKFRIWSHTGTMYRHLGRPADALAANDVARNLFLTRRDPLFASLGLARQGAILGTAQDRSGMRRTFDQAQEAMLRSDPTDYRPVWMLAFYDQAELDSLALSANLALGDYPTAEYHAHRCLAALRPHMIRSRAIATTRLAHAQLAQGAADAATATAMKVPTDVATHHARVARMLQEFGAALRATAPGSTTAQTWTEHAAAWRTTA